MHSPKLVLTAAWLALAGIGLALPSLDNLVPRQVAEDLPVATPTPVDAAETAGAGNGNKQAGHEFAMCSNLDGEFKPFCLPQHNETIIPNVLKYSQYRPTDLSFVFFPLTFLNLPSSLPY